MSFRFRLGSFTFGRTGVRLSMWRKHAGVSTPLFGESKQTFGVVRAGPLRWHFSKKLGAKRTHQGCGAHGLPTRNGFYKCPHCHTYRAQKINWIGKLKLRCAKCGYVSKLRRLKKIKKGLIFRRTIGYRLWFDFLARV
jgi:hypothetical protein